MSKESKNSGEQKMNDTHVVRVNKTEFELSDGRIYQHVVELEEDPDLDTFDALYRNASKTVGNMVYRYKDREAMRQEIMLNEDIEFWNNAKTTTDN